MSIIGIGLLALYVFVTFDLLKMVAQRKANAAQRNNSKEW